MMMYIMPSSGKKKLNFLFGLIQFIGSNWFDASLVRRLTQPVILTSFRSTQISVRVARIMKTSTFGLGLS